MARKFSSGTFVDERCSISEFMQRIEEEERQRAATRARTAANDVRDYKRHITAALGTPQGSARAERPVSMRAYCRPRHENSKWVTADLLGLEEINTNLPQE